MKRLSTIVPVLFAVAIGLVVADTSSAAGILRRGRSSSCDCAPACAAEPACAAAEPACCAAEPACSAEPACGAAEPACCASGSHHRTRRRLFSGRRSHHGSSSGCSSCCSEPACGAEPCCNAG